MNKEKIEQIAMEVLSNELPNLERENQSYYYGIVNILTSNIITNYAPNKKGSEEVVKELLADDLKDLINSMKYQKQ